MNFILWTSYFESGERGRLYTYRYAHHQNYFCIKVGSDERHFNVSLIVRDKVTRQCPQPTTFEEKGEPKRIRIEVPLLTCSGGDSTAWISDIGPSPSSVSWEIGRCVGTIKLERKVGTINRVNLQGSVRCLWRVCPLLQLFHQTGLQPHYGASKESCIMRHTRTDPPPPPPHTDTHTSIYTLWQWDCAYKLSHQT